ncbi:MAG: ATP-grasp domain-containing protein [Myxococcaceae bacterium]
MTTRPLNVLVLASYFKGDRFIRRCHARGARVFLLTQEKLLQNAWPREALADVFAQPDKSPLQHTLNTVSYLARSTRFDRIVPMDDFDVETAASLREHLRIPGMGDTTARHFRDKLAMRVKAQEEGIPVPEFVHVLNYDSIREFIAAVPAPWMLKPRSGASATGIVKVENEQQLWAEIDKKGDEQSQFLLERHLPGEVLHVDSIVSERQVVFAAVHRCGTPPFQVAHGGGIFTTRTVERGSPEETELLELNRSVLGKFGLVRGSSHTEYIRGKDGKLFLLETSARVGGAHIAEVCDAASGLNPWEAWADIEIDKGKVPYVVPPLRQEYAGVIMTLARQEVPDLSSYDDPEIVFRAPEKSHAGLVVRSKDPERVRTLLEQYTTRFFNDFHAAMPPPLRPSH